MAVWKLIINITAVVESWPNVLGRNTNIVYSGVLIGKAPCIRHAIIEEMGSITTWALSNFIEIWPTCQVYQILPDLVSEKF